MKTIIEMAREAEIYVPEHLQTIATCKTDLERFAELVRADEREACAKVCDEIEDGCRGVVGPQLHLAAKDCAAAIRARGNT